MLLTLVDIPLGIMVNRGNVQRVNGCNSVHTNHKRSVSVRSGAAYTDELVVLLPEIDVTVAARLFQVLAACYGIVEFDGGATLFGHNGSSRRGKEKLRDEDGCQDAVTERQEIVLQLITWGNEWPG
jgi:hypothetical protein